MRVPVIDDIYFVYWYETGYSDGKGIMVNLKLTLQKINEGLRSIVSNYTRSLTRNEPAKSNGKIQKKDIGKPTPIVRNDFLSLYSNSSSSRERNISNSPHFSASQDPGYESVTAEILEGYTSFNEMNPRPSSTEGIRSLGTSPQGTSEQSAKTRRQLDVPNPDSRMTDREGSQPALAPTMRLGRILEASTARRRTPVPEVPEAQLQKYESQHVSDKVKNRRDSLELSHSRLPLNIQNSDGSSNRFNRISKRRLPEKLFQSAVTRQGFDPSKPEDVKTLELKHANVRAPLVRAEREAQQLPHVSAQVKSRQNGLDLPHSQLPLNIHNKDGSSNQFDHTPKSRLPEKLFQSAVRRQGFDPSKPEDVKTLELKRTNEFVREEQEARTRQRPPQARDGYDERDRKARSAIDLT